MILICFARKRSGEHSGINLLGIVPSWISAATITEIEKKIRFFS